MDRWPARHFDGVTPEPRTAEVRLSPEGLWVTGADGDARLWRIADVLLVRGGRPGEPVQLELRAPVVEAVIVDDPGFATALRAAFPARGALKRLAPSPVTWRAVLVLSGILVALAVAAWRWGVPAVADLATRAVPESWERDFGEAVVAGIADPATHVSDPAVVEPIESIHRRLMRAQGPGAPASRVIVAGLPMANAFAAPGGLIVVTTPLLRILRGPDELAAVLAHEMMHVRHRHPTRALFARLSVDLLLGIIAGDGSALGRSAQLAGDLGVLSYGRADESAADRDAAELLAQAGVPPRAMIDALESLERANRSGSGVSFLSTHPSTPERHARLRGRIERSGAVPGEPLLPEGEWHRMLDALPPQEAGPP
jgi:predicted Zn-dependent protease